MSRFEEDFEGWGAYAAATAGRPPRPLLRRALRHVAARRTALDLGAGALSDSEFLLGEGFEMVTALDAEPVAQTKAASFPAERFQYVISRFEAFDYPVGRYDLVNAQYALPFIPRAHFGSIFGRILNSLRQGGILTGQLFGDRDEWASSPDIAFHSLGEARSLLAGMEILEFEEEDEDGQIASGRPKHWHAFHIIARRP